MNRIARLLAGLMALALIVVVAGCAEDDASSGPGSTVEATQWRVSLLWGLETPMGQVAQKFADLADEYTDGRLEVLLYPGSQLFPATEEWTATLTGGQDMFWNAGYFAGSDYPNMYVWFSLQGLWESPEHGEAVLEDGRLVETMATEMEEQFPIKVLGIHPLSTKLAYVTKDREISTLRDLEGLRATGNPSSSGDSPISQYAGLVEVPIANEEQLVAFVQGIVDVWQNGLSFLMDQKAYEIGNHIYIVPGGYYVNLVAVNRDSWDGLPADIQSILQDKVWPETYEFAIETARTAEEQDMEFMRSEMETYHESTVAEVGAIWEAASQNPLTKVMKLMIDPEIVEIVEELRPSRQ